MEAPLGVPTAPAAAGEPTGKPAAPAGAAAAAAAAGPSSHLTKKIQKALSLRVDSQTSRDALKCLSEFFDENSVQSRRNLRTTIEGRNLLLHKEFVDSFGALEKSIMQLDKF